MATGVPMDHWVAWGARAMATAMEVLDDWGRQRGDGSDGGRESAGYDGPQMSG